MKPFPLIALLLFCSLFADAQNTFNWGDTKFNKGEIRRINIPWNLDNGGWYQGYSDDTLKPLVNFLKKNPFIKIEVQNHTDPQGSYTHNMKLSQARAQSIADHLISQGIDSARIVAKGYGSTQPLPGYSAVDIAAMKTYEEKQLAYQANRRTEIRILSTCYNHETFNWGDTVFYVGSKRQIHIEYTLDKSEIADRSKPTLDSTVFFLKKNASLKIEVACHTDLQGSLKHDQVLSQARAQSITDYFINKGVDSARIAPKGYWYSQPMPGCSKEEIAAMKTNEEKQAAYKKDRRTEIVITGK
jgi:outer membrane protein OmpA-like peptidoglycan-associated protein